MAFKTAVTNEITDYYCNRMSTDYRSLPERVQSVLDRGYKFVSLIITERDSYGPVCSKVMIKSPRGHKLSWYI